METRKLHRDEVVTGVIQNNKCEFIHEDADNGINLRYEEAKRQFDVEHENEEDEDCKFFEYDGERGDMLIGYYYDEKTDMYEIDEKAEYSAIVNYDSHYVTQVTMSKYAVECHRCSPCYPNQGNIDDASSGCYTAFCPPPDAFGEFDEFDKSRIFRIEWAEEAK